MAARENTGLHAALIIFLMLTVGLAISTYVYFRSAEEAQKADLAKAQQLQDQTKKYQERDTEVRCLKYMLGWDTTLADADYDGLLKGIPNSDVVKIDEEYKKDMAMYGKGLEKPNYRLVPAELLKVIKAKNDELVTAIDEQKKLQAQVESVRQEREKDVKVAVDAQQAATADLTKRTAEFDQERTRMKGDNSNLLAQKTDLQTKLNESNSKVEKQGQDFEAALKRKDRTISSQKEEILQYREHENFEVPNGRITWVNQRSRSVLINLGTADGLRPQISFSVYDKGENSATKAEKKAGIEVIRVMEAHLSEARIVHDKTDDPILPGDLIYSPVWQSGRRLRFALTGFMDIDGDGENDRELVRNLILLNDGVIDLEQADDGKVDPAAAAKMTLQTRYLVEGELPANRVLLDAQLQGRNLMISKAQELGIERISVQKLLGYMGWKNEKRTTPLGRGATETTTPQSGGGTFRPRQPPAAAGDGP